MWKAVVSESRAQYSAVALGSALGCSTWLLCSVSRAQHSAVALRMQLVHVPDQVGVLIGWQAGSHVAVA